MHVRARQVKLHEGQLHMSKGYRPLFRNCPIVYKAFILAKCLYIISMI